MKIPSTLALPLALLASVGAWFRPAPDASRELRELMSHVSFVDMPDGNGSTVRTLRISGVNVQIVADGAQSSGNLIVGENHGFGDDIDDRSGSENLIVGSGNDYTDFGGVVFGLENRITGPFATITGGHGNLSSGQYSSVSGGGYNTASGHESSVSGGAGNLASGGVTSVSGGRDRTAVDWDDWAAGSLWEDQ